MFAFQYHDATKHDFSRFARSLGYLDWATQPDPFRRYRGATLLELPRTPLADRTGYEALFDRRVAREPAPMTAHGVGEFLRCSMGLSAWKQYGDTRWPLRVNPSSGNLHPTEAYVVWRGRVGHYAPREHGLEERCVLRGEPASDSGFLVALTSVHWREAWKYGERAFRYCQHDVGHALGALSHAASLLGWQLALLPQWSDADLAALLGLDRDEDFVDAEREEPECLAVVTSLDPGLWLDEDPLMTTEAARTGTWHGVANQLSRNHVAWSIIDEVARTTAYPGMPAGTIPRDVARFAAPGRPPRSAAGPGAARSMILQRRSATAFDGRSTLPRHAFTAMLARLQPPGVPWDTIDWSPQVHLVLFVHLVEGLAPGVYACVRDPAAVESLRLAMQDEFLWEEVGGDVPLALLAPLDCRQIASRLSCDQDIASDGFFSLGMLARFEPALRERGESFYRRLFWECGLIGQVLYLEAEAAGVRATGIGCFYDDPVHQALGLSTHDWQSLYHLAVGSAVDDTRLTTEPGYAWERPDAD